MIAWLASHPDTVLAVLATASTAAVLGTIWRRARRWYEFVKTMQLQMLGCDPTMDPDEAWDLAVETLFNFLEEERIAFGHPDHDWSRDGAITLIHEHEIHHWESAHD